MTPHYADDLVTLYHGDARMMPGLWADIVGSVLVTDPPYGRAWRQGTIGNKTENAASKTGIAGDDDTAARDEVLAAWGPHRLAIVFGDLMLAPPPGTRLTAVYAKPQDAGMRGAMGGVRRDAEAIYLVGPWASGLGGRSSVFRSAVSMVSSPYGVVARSGGHPHAKPLDVMEALISLTPPGSTIVDPFAGSGSTLRAAANLGRRAIGVEIDTRYADMAARRLAQQALPIEALP